MNVDTPSVLINLDRMEKNIAEMQRFCDEHNYQFRPHIKTHKIPEIAHMQLAAGAIGITCQKIGEAEVMAAGGIKDILIYYNILGESKLERLARLAHRANISVAVDSETTLKGIGEMAGTAGCRLGVFIDCDTGIHRTGVNSPADALKLAQLVMQYPNLEFKGLSTFPLTPSSGPWFEEAQQVFEAAHVAIPMVSAGSSRGPQYAKDIPQVTALCAGTYVFYDWSSVETGLVDVERCAASVVATVVSRPTATTATIDAGSKTLSSDFGYMKNGDGYGHILDFPQARIFSLSEEHGQVDFSQCDRVPEVGERVFVLPNHVCAMINLHDVVYGVRGDEVEVIWEVGARGKVR